MPWHLPSRQEVSGHSASGHSASLIDTEYYGKCPPDDACHGIYLLDEECQGICHLDTVHILQIQSIKANIVQTACATASAFQTQSV